jgi:hypothetical protein
MGEKINFVTAFASECFSIARYEQLTSALSLRAFGGVPRSWIAIQGDGYEYGNWPISDEIFGRTLSLKGVVSIYPSISRDAGVGAIVWSYGSRFLTITVAVPIEQMPSSVREKTACEIATETREFGSILSAVGSELELDGELELSAAEVSRLAQVELVAVPSAEGTKIIWNPRLGAR